MDDMTSSPYPPFDGVEPYGTVRSVADERAHRKRMCALGYRIYRVRAMEVNTPKF